MEDLAQMIWTWMDDVDSDRWCGCQSGQTLTAKWALTVCNHSPQPSFLGPLLSLLSHPPFYILCLICMHPCMVVSIFFPDFFFFFFFFCHSLARVFISFLHSLYTHVCRQTSITLMQHLGTGSHYTSGIVTARWFEHKMRKKWPTTILGVSTHQIFSLILCMQKCGSVVCRYAVCWGGCLRTSWISLYLFPRGNLGR